ncbi:hypothetical protein CEXT_460361 [Caerostris extrusa]|uniref:Uncharacterized protein n=1 Tax=Caerostris extrusa TaxID=172846 RepID=A0AAV4RD10_CAEEX|nr:hypothetical protein CEXT_460361 [Caerostris extrusa]
MTLRLKSLETPDLNDKGTGKRSIHYCAQKSRYWDFRSKLQKPVQKSSITTDCPGIVHKRIASATHALTTSHDVTVTNLEVIRNSDVMRVPDAAIHQ